MKLLQERTEKELELNQQLFAANQELTDIRGQIQLAETEMATLQATIKYYEEKETQITELETQIAAAKEKYRVKAQQKKDIELKMSTDLVLLSGESEIMQAAAEHEELKAQLIAM